MKQYESDKLNRSKKGVPGFLLKTYDIVNNPKNNEVIYWSPSGESFIVKNIFEFSEKILPNYFKHKNFTSFVRQLNMYDFHKLKSKHNMTEFMHPHFKRDQRKDLIHIERKDKFRQFQLDEQKEFLSKRNSPSQQDDPHLNCQNNYNQLHKKQKLIINISKILLYQNKKLCKQNEILWDELQQLKQTFSNLRTQLNRESTNIQNNNTLQIKNNDVSIDNDEAFVGELYPPEKYQDVTIDQMYQALLDNNESLDLQSVKSNEFDALNTNDTNSNMDDIIYNIMDAGQFLNRIEDQDLGSPELYFQELVE